MKFNLSEGFAAATVTTVLFKVLFAGASLKLGEHSVTFGSIDATTVAALLTPVLGALHLGSWVATKGKDTDEH